MDNQLDSARSDDWVELNGNGWAGILILVRSARLSSQLAG